MGASRLFSPLSAAAAKHELAEVLHRSPRLLGLGRSRWWLAGIRQVVAWLADCSLAGIWQLLTRLGLTYKRGRTYVHSPDPDYELKLSYVNAAKTRVRTQAADYVMLYQDELTYFRRPSIAADYAQRGSKNPAVASGYTRNRSRRIAACLDAVTGRFIAWQRAQFDRHTLIRFYQAIEAAYPTVKTLFLVQDNWSVHRHPDLLTYFTTSRIVPLWLPTYAPWTNPVEKVWLRLKQQLLHHHHFQDDWLGLQAAVQNWLDHCDDDPLDLLHFVGLSPS